MNNIIKVKNKKPIKLGVLLLLIFCGKITIVQAQEIITNNTTIKTQADLDWEVLDSVMNHLYTNKEFQVLKKKTSLEISRFYDNRFKKRSQLAEAFFYKYPEYPGRFGALVYFFRPEAFPRFIPEVIPDSLKQLLNSVPKNDHLRFLRLRPVDAEAMEQWRKKGDNMVQSFIDSDVSLEKKEAAEFLLISREFHTTTNLRHPLESFKKLKKERAYWNRFEIQYWQHLRLRLENHVNKYATLEKVADRVQNILTVINIYSPAASEVYWNYFFETTGSNHPQAEQLGVKALHKLASENVTALEALKNVDFTEPLEMIFTDMDGKKVDLANMRDKVVLIDFWATYCGPCIKEMPHVRAMYDKYRDKGFEVIGIAADNDAARERILNILERTGANWPQRLDKGADASVSFHALYKITSLPTVWLLNKDGVIVDRNARGKSLEPLIRKHLELDN